jgi:hypothetical protein
MISLPVIFDYDFAVFAHSEAFPCNFFSGGGIPFQIVDFPEERDPDGFFIFQDQLLFLQFLFHFVRPFHCRAEQSQCENKDNDQQDEQEYGNNPF